MEVFRHRATPIATEQVAAEPVKTVPSVGDSRALICSTPVCYRGHGLLLLRYMRSLLRLERHDPDVHTWVREVR